MLVPLFIFDDEAAHEAHGNSAAVRQFEAIYTPELTARPVVLTDYQVVASNTRVGDLALRVQYVAYALCLPDGSR